MNHAHIAGHLGSDPEVRFTSKGQKVTVLRLAARVRKGASGEDTIWWRVTIWGEQFDKMIPYLKKGSPLIVVGEISKPEIFNDREGKPQISMGITAMNILFSPFGRPDRNQEHHESSESRFSEDAFAGQVQGGGGHGGQSAGNSSFSHDDEVPF
jgi:single-strand DNA-binding protein